MSIDARISKSCVSLCSFQLYNKTDQNRSLTYDMNHICFPNDINFAHVLITVIKLQVSQHAKSYKVPTNFLTLIFLSTCLEYEEQLINMANPWQKYSENGFPLWLAFISGACPPVCSTRPLFIKKAFNLVLMSNG